MEVSSQKSELVYKLLALSQDIKHCIGVIRYTVQQLELAHSDAKFAAVSMPISDEKNKTLQLGLMRSILQRDTQTLLVSIIDLRQAVRGTIGVLKDSASVALAELNKYALATAESNLTILEARLLLTESLFDLDKLESMFGANLG